MKASVPTDTNDKEGRRERSGKKRVTAMAPAAGQKIVTREGDETGRMLRTLLGNLDGMVYRCRDDVHWTLEFVSEGCRRLTGYDPEDLLFNRRLSYDSLIHHDDRERVRKEIRNALATPGRFDCEYRIVHASGELRWVWERGCAVYDAQGAFLAIEGIVQDITARKRSISALREAERRYYNLFENALEGIFRTTARGQFLDANPALARIFGFDSPLDLMRSCTHLDTQLYTQPGRRAQFMALIEAQGSVSGFESEVRRKNGEIIWISENARAVCDDDGKFVCFEGTVEDITERKLYQARIEQQANYDTLTGLANRSLLNERLQEAIVAASKSGTRLAVVFVDLDRFKFINDSLGHHVGDELLRAIAARLKAQMREGDTVARLGGDEFVLIIKGQREPDSVAHVLERMLADISQPWSIPEGDFTFTCSMGVALYPDDGDTAETLLKHADSAMYRAKETGRNNIQFFTAQLNALATERLELENNLRRALDRNQFELAYQPRFDLRSGDIVGAEALIRWRMSDEQTIEPSRFIPIAEEIGLIAPIGQWVLEAACAQNKAWQDAGFGPLVVAVNVSARQFRQGSFVETVAQVLRKTGLAPEYLEIELTESAVMHDAEQFVAMLNELNDLGVQIAIDDFGTGYSSLSYLKRFPVDRLKVDRSFVQDIATDADDATIVRTIIALGHNLGLKVVAEGVETDQQLAFLRENACDEFQGFLYSAPLSAEEFAAHYAKSRLPPCSADSD